MQKKKEFVPIARQGGDVRTIRRTREGAVQLECHATAELPAL